MDKELSKITDNRTVSGQKYHAKKASIQTASGLLVTPLNITKDQVRTTDIIHSLCTKCRFTGHTSDFSGAGAGFYSVGQHSVLVSIVAQHLSIERGLPLFKVLYNAAWGLFHDSDEAYLPDFPTPLKVLPLFAPLRKAGIRARNAAMDHLELGRDEPPIVKEADRILLVTEKRDLMLPCETWSIVYKDKPRDEKIVPMNPDEAHEFFVARYRTIFGELPKS